MLVVESLQTKRRKENVYPGRRRQGAADDRLDGRTIPRAGIREGIEGTFQLESGHAGVQWNHLAKA